MGCVYVATNTENGKCYVGMTTRTLAQRRGDHFHAARKGNTAVFYKAIRKYGKDAFTWETLYTDNDAKKLFSVEQKYIERFDCVNWGYNMCYGGAGVVPTEELRAHKSESAKALHQNPEYVANRMAGIREYWSKPEVKVMAKDRAKRNTENPVWIKACKDSWTLEARERAGERMKIRMAEVKKNDPEFFNRRAKLMSIAGRESISKHAKSTWETKSVEEKQVAADRLRETMQTDKWKQANAAAAKKRCVPIMCVETGEVYSCATEAAKAFGTTRKNINAVACGKQKTTRGHTFVRVGGEDK